MDFMTCTAARLQRQGVQADLMKISPEAVSVCTQIHLSVYLYFFAVGVSDRC